jgi:hypothetical protein
MVMHFHRHTHLLENQAHLGAHVLQRIHRRNREVAAFDGRPVPAVAAFEPLVGGPGGFLGIDLNGASRHVHMPGDRVEDEEFRFGAEVSDIADAAGLQVGFGPLGQGPRVALIAFPVAWLDYIATHDERGLFAERIHHRGARIRHQLHVGGLDPLPAGDRRAVERMTVAELVFIEVRCRHRDVLLLALGIGEAEIDELDLVVGDLLHDVFGSCHSLLSFGVQHWIGGR